MRDVRRSAWSGFLLDELTASAPFLRAFRHQNFRLFFGGQIISLTGTWMQTVAEAWLVYRLTGSAALLGATAFVSQFPIFLFATAGGIVADRVNRRRVVMASQVVSMLLPLVLAALTFTGLVRVWHVFVLAAALGVVNAFDMPARQAFFVEMVGRDDLMNAIALNSSMVNAARVVGPAVAGLLIAEVGEAWCFLLNGLSYLAVIWGLLMMRVPAPKQAERRPSALHDTIEGFRFVVKTAPVRALLLLLGLIGFFGLPYSALMPIFADGILHGGPRGLGLMGAASGVGALCGALAVTVRQGVRGLDKWIAGSAAAFGVFLILFALSRNFWLSAFLLVPVSAAMMVQLAASNTLIQAMVPDVLRGRVMGAYAIMLMGMTPFGALVAGWTADRLGASTTVAVGGVICAGAGAIFALRLPSIRSEAHALIVAQDIAGH